MSSIYYRIQAIDLDTAALLDTDNQWSTHWANGDVLEGVSVCDTIPTLARYFGEAEGWIEPETMHIVAVWADLADDEDHDAAAGAILVRPTEIAATYPIDADFVTTYEAALPR